jgi:uncharacterized membrane protein YgdD (TMEM256/DUF423 family)
MARLWVTVAAIGGFLSVAAGAVAAHVSTGDARAAELLRTGALYGMVHSAALLAVVAIAGQDARRSLLLAVAGSAFAAGIVLFCFSLFGLAFTRRVWLAALTPFGGTALLIGWAALGLYAVRHR